MTKTTDKIFNIQPTLSDDLVRIRPLTEWDFESVYSVASDRHLWKQHPSTNRHEHDVFQEYFESMLHSKSLVISDVRSRACIGSTRFYDLVERESVSIGYTFIGRKYWGGVYNYSIKKLMIDYAFHFVQRIFFHVHEHNVRSQMAVVKLGAERGRDVNILVDGRSLRHFEYVLTKASWKEKAQHPNP